MTPKPTTLADRPLPAARSAEEHRLHQAALEWSLADTIVIQSADDIQSKAAWRDRVEPFDHQVQNLFTFCRRLPVTLLADDVGLGKTISAGLILSELMARKRVTRALVICPKLLAPQWVDELGAKFGIRAKEVAGGEFDDEVKRSSEVVVTTYQTATGRVEAVEPGTFGMVILDEAHKLRNLHGTGNPPQMALSVKAALERRLFRYVLMLTATPVQNRLWDLYSLIDCLTAAKGHANPLGSPEEFRGRFIMRGTDGRGLQPAAAGRFRHVVREYLVRTRRADARLQFPRREVETTSVPLTPAEHTISQRLAPHIAGLNALEKTTVFQALMSSPAALAAQLRNKAETHPGYRVIADEVGALATACPEPAKLRQLLSLCNSLAQRAVGWRLVVFTLRKETQALIRDALVRNGIPTGCVTGNQPDANRKAIAAFWTDPPGVRVLVSTDAGAEGINLQVANVLVNYDLPWNPMIVEQRIGRIQRLKSAFEHVVVVNLVGAGSVEERVVGRLVEKLQTVSQALGDIESILEVGREDGDAAGFEATMRELVEKALLGADVEAARRKEEASIDRGRKLIEEQQQVIDQAFGAAGTPRPTGPQMPKMNRCLPAMSAEEFVLGSFRAEGASVRGTSPGLYEVVTPSRETSLIAFDKAAAERGKERAGSGSQVQLFQPGTLHFERLVQKWVDRAGHLLVDRRAGTTPAAEGLARRWCDSIPNAQFVDCEVVESSPAFQGRAVVKVKAGNGVDSYEKLITREYRPAAHGPVPEGSDDVVYLPGELRPGSVLPEATGVLWRAVETDPDVGEFCRFYEARRNDELSRAGADSNLRAKVDADFAVAVQAEIAGVSGVHYHESVLRVRFRVRGAGSYEETIRGVPASGQLIDQPERRDCHETGIPVPLGCLGRCEMTGQEVLRHLLVTSPVSGRSARADWFVTCELTGQQVLRDETTTSAVSGTVGVRTEFVRCDQTGDVVLPAETATSDVSGRRVRRDLIRHSERPPHRAGLESELETCEVTGRRLLRDELGDSAASGRRVDRNLLIPSERSGRLALPAELVGCAETGVRLLPEETGVCGQTGRRVDVDLLARSEVSGTLVLQSLMRRCEVTGLQALPDELQQCGVTGAWVVPGELVTCRVTGIRARLSEAVVSTDPEGWILRSEAGASDYSGRAGALTRLVRSDKPPHRRALPEEIVRCEVTGRSLLPDEVGTSAVSGRRVDLELLVPSGHSGRVALAEEMVTCAESAARLLPEESARCAITGQVVDSRLTGRSEVSGVTALSRLLLRCEVTRQLALPVELVACQLTGKRVVPGEVSVCGVTGRRVLRSRLVTCEATNTAVGDDEVGRSALSARLVRRDLLRPSGKAPHRLGLEDEFATCEETGRRLLADELGESVVSGRRVDRGLLVPSAHSGALALSRELVTCEESGVRLLPAEVGRCFVSGKTVDARLLSRHEVTGRRVLTRLMRRCGQTRRLVLLGELERCAVTGQLVLPSELVTCAVTKKRGLPAEMIRSDVSGRCVVPAEAVRSAVSGRTGVPDETVRCAWLERRVLRTEASSCSLTRMMVAQAHLNQDGELVPLRALLGGRAGLGDVADDLIPLLASLDEDFKPLKRVRAVKSPHGGKLALCGELHLGWFGGKVRYIGFLLRTGKTPKLVGRGAIGYRDDSGWVPEDEWEFES